MSRKKRNADDAEDRAIEFDARSALAELGWLPPTTEAEVVPAEARLPESPLPDSLADAEALLSRSEEQFSGSDVVTLPGSTNTELTLRRAAREGGTIPPEIEKRMRRDRQQEEGQMDDKEHGQNAP